MYFSPGEDLCHVSLAPVRDGENPFLVTHFIPTIFFSTREVSPALSQDNVSLGTANTGLVNHNISILLIWFIH